MRTKYVSAVSLSLLVALAGCSSSGGGGSDAGNPAIQGSWINECEEINTGIFGQGTITITGTDFAQVLSIYVDSLCPAESLAAETTLTGTFIDGESTEVAGVTQTEVDVSFEAKSETWYLAGDIEDFNGIERCGISNWEAGVSFDVGNCAEAIDGTPIPVTLYHLYGVSGDGLYFGDPGFSQTPEGRPTSLGTEPSYTKQ